MKTVEEQEHVFNMMSAKDFQDCRDALLLLESQHSEDLKVLIIKYAVICYARPFTKNKGVAIGEEKHAKRYRQIPTDIFDSEHDLQCHSEICRLRDQLIAHSDIGLKNPEFLSRDAIGTNLAISTEDWEKLAENLRRLTKTAFNHLAEIITGHRRPSSGGEPEKPES